jgi:hypothetical protein
MAKPRRATQQELLTYAALFGATVVGMHVIPGPWTRWSEGKVVDKWWLTHVFWGWLGARMNQSLDQQMALTAANELGEAWIRQNRPDLLWGTPETPANVAMDFVGNALGWWLGRPR